MFYHDTGRHQRALRAASEAMIAEGHAQEALLAPSEFDTIFTIDSPWWPHVPTGQDVAGYIDTVNQEEGAVDFVALQDYVFTRREVAFKKNGIIYDPIDDAGCAPIPERGHLWGMLRQDQIERHLDEILASGAVVHNLAQFMPVEFSETHRDALIAAGVELRQPSSRTGIAVKIAQLIGPKK